MQVGMKIVPRSSCPVPGVNTRILSRNQEPGTRNAFGLYIHIPFCLSKCVYCDFNSFPHLESLHGPYLSALKRETGLAKNSFQIPVVTSIFFGGGTPTVYSADDLTALLKSFLKAFPVAPGAEITLEANPETVHLPKLRLLRQAGFNRLSIGFQSLDNSLLKSLGRRHSREDALRAYGESREAGFENIGLDLIFGIEGQSLSNWQASLQEVVSLAPEHISTYALELMGKPAGLWEACEDDQAEMFECAISYLSSHGYRHYEISNFAREGRDCRHNLNYWRNGEYLGLGAGAHSHLSNRRFSNLREPCSYISALELGKEIVQEDSGLSSQETMEEEIFLGLRLREGVELSSFEVKFGVSLEEAFPGIVPELTAKGLVFCAEGRLKLTERGLFLGNDVLSSFL